MYKTTQGWLESYTPNNALLSNIKHNVDYFIHFYCSPWEITPKKGCWSWSLWPSLMPPLCGGYPLKEFFYLKSKPSLSLLCCISAQGPVVINVGVRPVTQRWIVQVFKSCSDHLKLCLSTHTLSQSIQLMICLHLSECETVKNCLCIEILFIINKYKVNEHIEGLISSELNHGSLMESLLFVQWA